MTGPRLDAEGRAVLDDLFDKWSLLVLDVLCDEQRRFSDLRRALPEVTPKSLTATLRRLERNGVIRRDVVIASPISVSYAITPLGRSLEAPLQGMLRWVVDHADEVAASRRAASG